MVIEVLEDKKAKYGKASLFSLGPKLDFQRRYEDDGAAVFSLVDLEGNHFEFVCDKELTSTTVEMFHLVVAQCLWEHFQRRPFSDATDSDIQRLVKVDRPIVVLNDSESILYQAESSFFYVFDVATNLFVPKLEGPVRALITIDKKKAFSLVILEENEQTLIHRQVIDPDATLHTDRKNCSFVWCHFNEEGITWTYSLRFADAAGVMGLSNAMGQVIYEILNDAKIREGDEGYLIGGFTDDVIMGDADIETDHDESSAASSDDDEPDHGRADVDNSRSTLKNSPSKSGGKNQHLTVGFKHDRSFVTRGDSISIFKHTTDDDIELLTDIDQIRTADGRVLAPRKMMLHEEDRSLLLLDHLEKNKIHKMDVEYGKVVEEWNVHDDEAFDVTAILPDSKYAQLTNQQTLIGLNANSIFRVDPRLSGNKRVDKEMKKYVVKNDFSCGATTGVGELAVGSSKGEIRLFDKIDKRAKTLLPGFGDAIIAIDVTESGRYIVATCKTYLLLICTEMPGTDSLGFAKPMGANKPVPRRLQLRPEHVAYLGTPVSFTPARFSTGQSEERSIITSTGPYVITWNLRRVKQGKLYDYQIRKYEDKVVADNFRYGQDRSIVVTLPHHVTMISKRSLSTPSPQVFRGRPISERRESGHSKPMDPPISIGDLILDDN